MYSLYKLYVTWRKQVHEFCRVISQKNPWIVCKKRFLRSTCSCTCSCILYEPWFMFGFIVTYCTCQLPVTHNIILLFWNAVDFVIPKKGESLLEAYETWRKWADEKGTNLKNKCFYMYMFLFNFNLCALAKIKFVAC